MLDERTGCALQTRDERMFVDGTKIGVILSPFDKLRVNSTKWSRKISIYALCMILLTLSACTDYEAMIDDEYEQWLAEQEEKSSSSGESSEVDEGTSSSIEQSSNSRKNKSSSSESPKSSSSQIITSSLSIGSELVDGVLVDHRDDQRYKTVTIGTQIWMAENLNYETENSYCYNDLRSFCSKYGKLYTWDAATTACPSGWHLPSKTEWETLFAAVGDSLIAGKVLKSKSDWNSEGNGTDEFGFSALPAGDRKYDGTYYNEKSWVNFWCSTESGSDIAYHMYLGDDYDRAFLNDVVKNNAFSVRCLLNDEKTLKSSSSNKDSEPADKTSSSSESSKSSSSSAKSSSSKTLQSSSSQKIVPSSSSNVVDPVEESSSSSSKVPEPVEGTLTDSRDSQTYKTVTIGSQVWMAENLNYETDDSYCYNDTIEYCSKYGRFYTWAAAMDSAGTWSSNGKGCGYGLICSSKNPVRGVCPEGWHLPTKSEWNFLFETVGGVSSAGTMLKASVDWKNNGDNADVFRFSALPAGNRDYEGGYVIEGFYAYFWSSTQSFSYYEEDPRRYAYCVGLYNHSVYASLDEVSKLNGFSVRCLKD